MAARPVFYGPLARWADRRAARADADHDIYGPLLEDADEAPTAPQLVPPYIGSLNHRFGEQANAVRYCLQELIKSLDAERVTALEQIAVLDHRLSQVGAQLDAFPVSAPPEMLTRRNSVEHSKPAELVAARNQRDWQARRKVYEQKEADLTARRQSLADRVAVLTGKITAAKRTAAAIIQRHHEHARRRGHAYQRSLLQHHQGGAALLAVLDFAAPPLPNLGTEVDHFLDAPASQPPQPAPDPLASEHVRQNVIGA
jgi:hypothetical protein